MAGGIRISLVADVAPFVKGMQSAEDALEDVGGSLDDVARDAQQAGRDAGRDLAHGVEAGTDDAGDATRDLERSFKDLARDVSKHSKSMGDDVGHEVKRGAHDAGEGLDEFKTEAGSTARETAASFSGSADDIAGSFQEVAANALAGFGPVGTVAGLALAAGIGTFWTNFQADAAAAAKSTEDAFDDMIDSGSRFLSAELLNQRMRDIVSGNEDAVASFDEVTDAAERTGVDGSIALRAFAGDQDAANAMIGAAQAAMDAIDAKYSNGGPLSKAAVRDKAQLRDVVNALEGVQGATDTAADRADVYRAAAEKIGPAAQTASDRAVAAYDMLGRKVSTMPQPVITPTLDTAYLDRQIKRYKPPMVNIQGNVVITGKGRTGQNVQ
jgi:hypothetical protein